MRQFHDLAYLADKRTIDDAKLAHATMTVYIQWSNMPQEIKDVVASEPGESKEFQGFKIYRMWKNTNMSHA